MSTQMVFGICLTTAFSLLTAAGALWYARHARIERPPIGRFNSRDLAVLGVFIVAIPFLYLALPGGVVTAMLVITFLVAGVTTLRPLLAGRWIWLLVPAALTSDILVTAHIDDLAAGKQIFWILNSAIVIVSAIGIGNLYGQCGLTLRHVVWFTAFLGVYDILTARVFTVTRELAFSLQGTPLDPTSGFEVDGLIATVGLGDLLMFSLFAVSAYKEFGRRGARTALVAIFVAIAPAPYLIWTYLPGLFTEFIPVQTTLAPTVFLSWLWLSRSGSPRSTRQWFADTARRARPRQAGAAVRPPRGATAAAIGALVLATVFATGEGAAVGGNSAVAADGRASAPRGTVTIVMARRAFLPAHRVVHVGQTVRWVSEDLIPHDAVSTAGASFRSRRFTRGGSYRWTATRPGTIEYVCTLHPGMDGTLTVVS